jgi:eukaryotic-like serine/threonine-protein kinase
VSDLEVAASYELGSRSPMQVGTLYPAYMRGEAYLLAHNGRAAAAEFQKLVDHRGIVANFITASLAHLQLGRSYVVAGDIARAKGAYQDFLTLERRWGFSRSCNQAAEVPSSRVSARVPRSP